MGESISKLLGKHVDNFSVSLCEWGAIALRRTLCEANSGAGEIVRGVDEVTGICSRRGWGRVEPTAAVLVAKLTDDGVASCGWNTNSWKGRDELILVGGGIPLNSFGDWTLCGGTTRKWDGVEGM